jgi:hypothetical protein
MAENMKSHWELVKSTKTRETRAGITIKVGTAYITICDPDKVEEVRQRFQEH